MSITGYYDGTVIRVDKPLRLHQKVIVIPVEDNVEPQESAAGALHKYANPALIKDEKDAWKKAVARKHGRE